MWGKMIGAWGKMIGALVAGLTLTGCAPSAGTVLANGSHCGDVELGPDLTMRVLGYVSRWDHTQVFYVYACARKADRCRPVAFFFHALQPAFESLSDGTINVDIFGGHLHRLHDGPMRVDGHRYVIHVREVGGSGPESAEALNAAVDAFRKRSQIKGDCAPYALL